MDHDLIFSVDVDFTDRTRSGGRFNHTTHRVVVLARTDTDASILAATLVSCFIGRDDMVIATRIVDVAV